MFIENKKTIKKRVLVKIKLVLHTSRVIRYNNMILLMCVFRVYISNFIFLKFYGKMKEWLMFFEQFFQFFINSYKKWIINICSYTVTGFIIIESP